MAERWVVNASPVILLGKAGVIHLLPDLCDELVVPAGVVAEVESGRMADAGRAWLDGDGGKVVQAAPPLHVAVGRTGMASRRGHRGVDTSGVFGWRGRHGRR